MTGIDLVKAAVRALDEKKAEDIEVIQITELSVVADYFVIANGTSNTHVRALASEVEDALSKQGVFELQDFHLLICRKMSASSCPVLLLYCGSPAGWCGSLTPATYHLL